MQVIHNFFSQDQLDYLLALPALQSAFIKGVNQSFSVDVGADIQATLNRQLALNLPTKIPPIFQLMPQQEQYQWPQILPQQLIL